MTFLGGGKAAASFQVDAAAGADETDLMESKVISFSILR